MAKKPKSKKQAPAEWQGAVDASAANDSPSANSGVIISEDGDPVVLEDLTLEERADAGKKLGELNIELRVLEQDGRDTASSQRKKVKELKKKIATLSDEAHEGVRKVLAQKTLPLEDRA